MTNSSADPHAVVVKQARYRPVVAETPRSARARSCLNAQQVSRIDTGYRRPIRLARPHDSRAREPSPLARKLRGWRSRSCTAPPTLKLLSPPMPSRPLAFLTDPARDARDLRRCARRGATTTAPRDGATPLTLQQAEQTALRNQPNVRAAHGLQEAAEGRVEEARAGYLPQVDRDAEATSARPATSPPTRGVLPNDLTTAARAAHRDWRHGRPTPVIWNPKYNYFQLNAARQPAHLRLRPDQQQVARRRAPAATPPATTRAPRRCRRCSTFGAPTSPRARQPRPGGGRARRRCATRTSTWSRRRRSSAPAFSRTSTSPPCMTALANAKVQLVTARNNFAVAEAQLSQAMGVSVSEQLRALRRRDPAHRRARTATPAPLVAHG